MKDWYSNNDTEVRYSKYNRIIVQVCVKYYNDCWRARNQRRNSPDLRRKILLEWYANEIAALENLRHPQVSKYISAGAERILNASNNSIQQWLIAMHTIRKTGAMNDSMDIRSFFQPSD